MWRSGDLSLAYLTVDGASVDEHLEAAAAAGFAAAGLRILPPSHLTSSGSVIAHPDRIRRAAQSCASWGVRPLDAEVMCLSPSTGAGDIDAMVSAAAEIGFQFVQTVVEDDDANRATETLGRLAEAAAQAGVGIALEFMVFRPLSSLDAAQRMIERCGSDNVGLVIDALHLSRSGGTPDMLAALPTERIALVQLCDAPAALTAKEDLVSEARNGRLHPGEGGLRLDELLDVLPDGIPLSLEVPHRSFVGQPFAKRASKSMVALKQFLERRARRLGP